MCDEDSEIRKISLGLINYRVVPDAEAEMANTALQEFERGEFEKCLNTFKKLIPKRPQDLKVLHNAYVTEYYYTKCKTTSLLKTRLQNICKKARIDIQDIEVLDDVDNCVVLYNQAVLLFHLHQFHAAISILDKVFQFIEPLDETLGKNICFLLLELYLCVYCPKKALCLVGYMETLLFSGAKNCAKSNQKEKENHKEENNENGMVEILKRRLQLCKARCFAMIKTSKACKREIKNLMASGSGVQNIPAFYLKSQLEYQRGNYRKALKLLHSVTLPDDISKYFKETGDCLPAIFYNNVGCIHFYMGKPNLGSFYINRAIQELNNHLNSVTEAADCKINSRPLHLMSISTYHQLLYNLGMQYLQAQKYQLAFSCLIEVVRSFHSNPRLWLRIAECCIAIHKPDNTNQFTELKNKHFFKDIVGSGIHRKIILNSLSEKLSLEDSKSGGLIGETPSLHLAMLCLKNALFRVPENNSSVNNSEAMNNLQGTSDDNDTSNHEENSLQTLPSNFIQGTEIISLKNSILIASSYVALCLGDVILAHEYAKTVLSQPKISAAHTFLAHLYAGEALLIMDRITEAVEHLSFEHINDIDLAVPVTSLENSLKHQMRFDSKLNEKNDDGSRPVGNIPNWFPNTISTAKYISQYNLAVAYAVREEWSKALECLLQMNPNNRVPPQALSLLVYIQMHQGVADDARTYIKQCNISGGNA